MQKQFEKGKKQTKQKASDRDRLHPSSRGEGRKGAAETEREKGEALSYYKLCPPSKTHSQLDDSKA
jgi:hypothetical protein